MNDDNLAENSKSSWGNKTLISIFASIVLGTNAFNAYIHTQDNNTQSIQYESELARTNLQYQTDRSDKKDKRVLEQAEQMIKENNYIQEIKSLKKELKDCKDE
jgi:peptidoglycan hydrolase CwlO-like protein